MEVLQRGEVHDVVVIGSGASGAMAAHALVEHGVRVLMLDAGWKFDRSLSWAHVLPFEADRRLQQGDRPQQFRLDAREQPYLTPEGRPFDLYRTWGWGGKTNVWGRVSLRMADLDFAGPERDGWDIPWPIRYEDIAPYYDRVEQLIGVTGGDDDSDSLPGSRYHLPPVRPRCTEVLLTRAAESLGIPCVPIRRAVLTRPHGGRSACHYCGSCGSGCRTASYFNATDYLLLPAIETGRLEIVSGAVAARVTTDSEGRASGVQYFERESGAERHVRARTVVVAASAMDSTRILLNSQSTRHPNGLGNGNDQLGRNYCEQVRFHRHGFLPQLFGRGYTNDDGIGGGHTYIPRFNHRLRGLDYLRGFGIQMWMNGCQTTGVNVAERMPGLEFGAGFKRRVEERYPALASLHPYGEMLPRPDNRVTVDPDRTDRYGVPLMHIDVRFSDNEMKMVRHMHQVADEILKTAGAEMVPASPDEHDPPGAGHPRARHGPHGRGSGPLDAQPLQPDARGGQRLRRRRLVVHHRVREEPDADDSRPRLARRRLPGGGAARGAAVRATD